MTDDALTPYCNEMRTLFGIITGLLAMIMVPIGWALYQAGQLRRKNTITIVMQTLTATIILMLLWFGLGFSLVQSPVSNFGLIGDFTFSIFMKTYNQCSMNGIPIHVFAMKEGTMSLLFSFIILGSLQERLFTIPSMVYVVLLNLFIYYPITHWLRSPNGFLHVWLHSYDFGGSLTVHGVSGLVCSAVAVVFFPSRSDVSIRSQISHRVKASNIPIFTLGGTLLLIGLVLVNMNAIYSFGFDSFKDKKIVVLTLPMVTSVFSMFSSAAIWGLVYRVTLKRYSLIAMMRGAIVGVIACSSFASFTHIDYAIALSMTISAISVICHSLFNRIPFFDDATRSVSVHGVSGLLSYIIATMVRAISSTHILNESITLFDMMLHLSSLFIIIAYSLLVTFFISAFFRMFVKPWPKDNQIYHGSAGFDKLESIEENAYNLQDECDTDTESEYESYDASIY
eukprot:CAMPEP_0117422076 /NCGR_PEP_ID=MMETSP0758-20121206/2987_1 /TAXON_ID=63605 /ORGANISM="Percolomonas cosmopolitus, Strain AE-1 (ATCC 50343)" /LENGTH=452 /DNA_ID=CAMNT_0005204477 /DNA_START=10 /DNA_END=1365 /DNA_ORIENTATION=-